MKDYQVKLSPIVKEQTLVDMGFVKSLGIFYGGFEVKKGVQVCLAIDYETKLAWIAVDNDNIVPPENVMKKRYELDEEECEYMEAQEVKSKYPFDLGFEIPQVLLQLLMCGMAHIEKKEGK